MFATGRFACWTDLEPTQWLAIGAHERSFVQRPPGVLVTGRPLKTRPQGRTSGVSMRKARYALAVVAPHPIQYMAGLWWTLARHPRIDLRVIYLDRVGLDGAIDPTMQAAMKWDVPLLDGYEHEFVRNLSPLRFTPIVHRINPGIRARLTASRYDAVILHGYLTLSNWIALPAARRRGIKVVYRGEGSMQGGERHDSPL